MKITDSEAKPFIEQKDVILCRSGIQIYHKSELASFITEDNKPPVEKEWYREYRPASVVVKAQKLFQSLPVTKEHPSEWVTPKNWSALVGGVLDKEISVVALDGESEGEIGLKSNITFYTDELYDYYKDNKEVSVGYTCKKHFVDNPEELGYDIELDEITEVNHLAITRAGRGGSSVAVIDSIIGGLKPMRTGIFALFASKKQKVNDSAPSSFGKEVLEAVKNSKGTTEEELAGEMKGVMDSCAILKDCEAKDTLLDVIRDCFDNKEKALENAEELTSTLDSMYVSISGDSLNEIVKACAKLKGSEEPKATVDTATNKDSDENADEKSDKKDEKTDDSEAKKDEKSDEKEEKTADSEEKKDEKTDEKDSCNKDSATIFATKDDIAKAITDSVKPLVMEAVKECLGIKENSKPSVKGGELDSATKARIESYDYTSFLEQ